MSEYRLVQHATMSPTRCFFCLEYVGPFIDTNVEDPAFGHVYICGPTEDRPGCIGQMAAMFGMFSAREKEIAQSYASELKTKVEQLEQKQMVQLTYDDLLKVMTVPKRASRTLVGKTDDPAKEE